MNRRPCRPQNLLALRGSVATALMFLSCPAVAFYAEVKPALKIGVDCIGQVTLLAPKLKACTIGGARSRIWCPNGRMFEGSIERDGPQSALARSLCNMTQVP
jgi:hypothetical protein